MYTRLLTLRRESLLFIGLLGSICLWAQPEALSEEQQIRAKFIEATTEYVREDYDRAREHLEAILEKDSDNAAGNHLLAKIELVQGQLDEALIHALKSRDISPENIWYHILLRDIYLKKGASADGLKVQQELVKRFPGKILEEVKLLELYKDAGQFQEAEKLLIALADRTTPLAIGKIGYEVYLGLGEQGKAQQQLERLIAADPANTEALLLLYNLYAESEKNSEAILILEELIGRGVQSPDVVWIVANYHLNLQDTSKYQDFILPAFRDPEVNVEYKVKALEMLKATPVPGNLGSTRIEMLVAQTLEAHKGQPGAMQLRGDIFFLAAAYDSAVQVYKAALELDPAATGTWEKLLHSAEMSGNFERLLFESEEAMAFFPNQASILCYYGLANVRQENWAQALYAFNKLEKLPQVEPSTKAKYLREWAYMEFLQENFQEAFARIQTAQAVQIDAWGFELAGDILHKLGKSDEAREQWILAMEHGAVNLNIEQKLTQ